MCDLIMGDLIIRDLITNDLGCYLDDINNNIDLIMQSDLGLILKAVVDVHIQP